MHVLYFPLITDDVSIRRPDAGWARRTVRDTAEGWRCVLLFRPSPELAEYALWERTRDLFQRFEACVDESADSAYLLAQRAVKVIREAGFDSGDTFRYALLVSDGHKLHFYLKGFRCLLWGVPVEGSPPLRLAQEDKRNVIESRDFPSLQRRDLPQATPFIAEPVVAVVDEANPDGLLPSFAKSLESLLVLGGPVSLHQGQSTQAAGADAATWHLWEEMSNLAAVDMRRLESRLALLTERVVPSGPSDGGLPDLWRRVQPYVIPSALVVNVLLLLVLLLRGPAPAPAPTTPAVSESAGEASESPPAAGLSAPTPRRAGPLAVPRPAAPERPAVAAPVAAPTPAEPSEPPAAVLGPRGATAKLARFVSDAPPDDRTHFTQPVKLFIDRRILPYLEGEPLTERARRTMVDVAVQLLTNRRCGREQPPVRVDGEVGQRTLDQVKRCARDGSASMEAVAAVFDDAAALRDLDKLERKIAAAIDE